MYVFTVKPEALINDFKKARTEPLPFVPAICIIFLIFPLILSFIGPNTVAEYLLCFIIIWSLRFLVSFYYLLTSYTRFNFISGFKESH